MKKKAAAVSALLTFSISVLAMRYNSYALGPYIFETGPSAGSSSSSVSSSGYWYTVDGRPTKDTTAGSAHSGEASSEVDLGFTVVYPTHYHNGILMAEGSVQLSDGSWAELGYTSVIRGTYYRLLREVTDTTGEDWYVVAANGSMIGDYYTPDGTVVTELWLKKSDCAATSTISLSTTDPTRINIVKTALSKLGDPYQYGATGPDAFDCSGFVHYVMAANGISVPRTSEEICSSSGGTEVGITGLLPGDIVARAGHVGIYITDDYFVHASGEAVGVVSESIAIYNWDDPFTNYISMVN